MSPEDPRHGSYAGAGAHRADGEKECFRCLIARSEYDTHRSRMKAYGRWEPYVDAEPARQHVRSLFAGGSTIATVAAAVGVADCRVSHLIYGRGNGRRPPTKIRPDYAAALLALTPEPTRVSSLGTSRRLQALVARGYSSTALAEHLGMSQARADQLMRRHQATIMRGTHDRVANLYERLSMTPPPETNRLEKYRASRARNTAARHGWPPPLAWDDIDDPDEHPTDWQWSERSHYDPNHADDIDPSTVTRILGGDWHLPCTPAEKEAVIEAWQGSLTELAKITGWRIHRYTKKAA